MSSLAERLLPISLVVHRIADDRTGHAVTATATAAEFGANDRDDLDPFFAQQSIRVRVSIVGKDDTRRRADKICAAIPLRPLAHIGVATGLDHAQFLEAKRLGNHL